jgi:hypothetical protein
MNSLPVRIGLELRVKLVIRAFVRASPVCVFQSLLRELSLPAVKSLGYRTALARIVFDVRLALRCKRRILSSSAMVCRS